MNVTDKQYDLITTICMGVGILSMFIYAGNSAIWALVMGIVAALVAMTTYFIKHHGRENES